MTQAIYPHLSGSKVRPKIIRYFLANPDTVVRHTDLFRTIEEDAGSGWHIVRDLLKVGLIKRDPRYCLSLNKEFVLLPELYAVYECRSSGRGWMAG